MAISVFLSTVSDEFRAYRDQLRHDLTRHNVAVKVQEDFKDLGGDTLDNLDVYIAECDGVVHLVGNMTGAAADGREQRALMAKHSDLSAKLPPLGDALKNGLCLPYTQWEAYLALYHRKPLMIAEAGPNAPRGPCYAPNAASGAAQAEHLARLKAYGRYGCVFANANDLATSIAYSQVLDLLVADRDRARGVIPEGLAAELLAIARKGGVFEYGEEKGFAELAVRKMVLRLGGEGVRKVDLLPWLENWIEKAQRELGRRTNEDQAFESARQESERRLRAGLDNPSSALMEEFVREEQAEAERQVERRHRSIRILEEAIQFDELGLDAEAAATKLRRLAEVEGRSGWREIGDFLFIKAGEFFERGDQKGENAALFVSIEVFRAVLGEWTRERLPSHWAASQSHLGNALATLGGRESGTARLKEAVAAYRAALEERTRERVPRDWAVTQMNLGNALTTLGGRESGTARLKEAVAACRAALEERKRERFPPDWAMTQMNLGNALQALGERESGTEKLQEAVLAYRAALEEYTRERFPPDWAKTQMNLGGALRTLGVRESATEKLKEAVEAYRAALEELTRQRVPLDWATTQNNLGNALASAGEQEGETAALEEAVKAYRAALEERTRKRVPLGWAETQNNLGNVLAMLGEREIGTARLEEAVEAFRAALEEWTPERGPPQWAATQNNLGDALRVLGERGSGTVQLEEAVIAYRAALREQTRELAPVEWAASFGGQGFAMMLIADRTNNGLIAQTAFQQIQTAVETLQSCGQEQRAACFRDLLSKSQVIRHRLKTR